MTELPGTLWLVRHGESAGNVAREAAEGSGATTIEIEGRDVDVPLSELGERQACALGEWFRSLPAAKQPTVVLSSPYLRAQQTSQLLLQQARITHAVFSASDERLREKEFGTLNRLTRAGLVSAFPNRKRLHPAYAGGVIATPHSGERAEIWGCEREEVMADPLALARKAAAALGGWSSWRAEVVPLRSDLFPVWLGTLVAIDQDTRLQRAGKLEERKMNERDRYRGVGPQRGHSERGNSERGESDRNDGLRSRDESGDYASRDESRFGLRGNDPQNEGDAQSTSRNQYARNQYDRNQYDQRGFGRDARDSQQSGFGQSDRAYGEQDRVHRGGSSGFAAGSLPNLVESPWSNRSDFYRENRGDSAPSYGRSQGNGSLSNFGARTRSEAGYYAGGQEGQGHSGRGPKGYARSDERIREDVCERLSENDEVDASDVEVTVSNREVTLSGSIETRRMKHISEDIADAVSGVEDVHNNITVRKAFLKEMADRITGDDDKSQHHAYSGTKSSPTSGSSLASGSTSSLGSSGSLGSSSSSTGANGRA